MKRKHLRFKVLIGITICLIAFCSIGNAQTPIATTDAQMQQWRDAKFGLFLHWGLYSQAAGDWKDKPYKGNEHFMIYEKLSLKEYGSLAKDFNPTSFNAGKWVKAAKQAGMKYIIITSKHHDGFAMFNSHTNDYNIVKQTPFKRDPLKELADSCKAYGMKLGFYYSLGRDWEDPDVATDWPTKGGRSNVVDYPNEDAKDFSKYFERKVKPQVKQLLSEYGPVSVIWFDTPERISKPQSEELYAMVKSLQPNCIVNNRVGNGWGDFKVSEQQITDKTDNQPWESCITMSKGWGYNKHDTEWKSPELIVRQLVEVVCKGGNLLLNIGPKGDGTFPPQAIERLKAVGKWMNINSEAIYGTKPWMVAGEQVSEVTLSSSAIKIDVDNDATSKAILPDIYFAAKGKVIYVFARSWKQPVINIKSISADKFTVAKVTLLGAKTAVKWNQNKNGLNCSVPPVLPDEVPVYVFKVQLK